MSSDTIDAMAAGSPSSYGGGYAEGLFDYGGGVIGGVVDVAQAAASAAIDAFGGMSGYGMGFSVDPSAVAADSSAGGSSDSLGIALNVSGPGYSLIDLNNGMTVGSYMGPAPWNTGGGGT
jgi:hypothetical protein